MSEKPKLTRGVSLRSVDGGVRSRCLGLTVKESQAHLVATVAQSLAEAEKDSALHPFAIFDASARGWVDPAEEPIGFAMIELVASVGFIQRILIDQSAQGFGYGRAALLELIRRLRLRWEVEMIATSYRRENDVMARLTHAIGFVSWNIGFTDADPREVFVRLPDSPL